MSGTYLNVVRELFSGFIPGTLEVLQGLLYFLYFSLRILIWDPEMASALVVRLWANVGAVLQTAPVPLGGFYYFLAVISTPCIYLAFLSPVGVYAGFSFIRKWFQLNAEREQRGINTGALYKWLHTKTEGKVSL